MTNNTTAALTDEQRSRIEYALDYMGDSGFTPEADILRALLTSPRAAVPREQFRDLLRAALKRYRGENPSRYLNDDQVDAQDAEFASTLADHHAQLTMLDAAPAAPVAEAEPIPMLLFCPRCGTQHIDAPETVSDGRPVLYADAWTNPPHRSHLCHTCGIVWRPADVATVGVEAIETSGKADTWEGIPGVTSMPAQAVAADGAQSEFVSALILAICELPDRHSPEGEPGAMVANSDEISHCVDVALEKTGLSISQRAAVSTAPAADMSDAYVGAREDLAIWKRRALEAEGKVGQLTEARKLLAHASEFAMMQLDEDWHERAASLLALPAPAVSASAPPRPAAAAAVEFSYALSQHAERWSGSFDSIEGALAEALSGLDDAGERDRVIWVGQNQPIDIDYDSLAEEVIERIQEQAFDQVGEVADVIGPYEETETKLLSLAIKRWIDEHGQISCYRIDHSIAYGPGAPEYKAAVARLRERDGSAT
ncbi:hypothetical protein [Burkholderia gladioli]|uniref:hypothetical protein n=1 Tax=Burkholderia gladioli TaxID=28095 RepID=UPI00163FCDB1|nr:hypothetical protein [Burkholderia gladioli]